MRNKISMKVLMEAMNKLETEAYKDHVPGYGKGKGASTKNWSMTPSKLAKDFEDSEKTSPERPSLKRPEPSSEEDEYIQSLLKVAEDMAGIYFDDKDATRTTTYDLADTQEDEPYDTTEMVGFVDAAADALAANLSTNMKSFHGLSPEQMEDKVKKELMDVLKDMDATDLYDRS